MPKKLPVVVSVMGAPASARKPWFEVYPQEETDAQYVRNTNRIKNLERHIEDNPKRPFLILLMSFSGRNNKLSCAHEKARSTKVVESLQPRFEKEGFKTKHLDMWDLNIEHCNGCYGSHDSWCHWPCTCWPFDDMMQIYELFTLADAIIIGSPVNEAAPASRFKEMWDRLISMDGGMQYTPPAGWKKTTEEKNRFREKYGGREKGIHYNQRIAGKPFGIVILGHELGAQSAVSSVMASVYYRGGYVPSHCVIPKIYAGAGPNAIDELVLDRETAFREELEGQLDLMVDQMVQDVRLNRTRKIHSDEGDRT